MPILEDSPPGQFQREHSRVWLSAKRLRTKIATLIRPTNFTLTKYSKFLRGSFLEKLSERDPRNLNEQTLLFSLAVSDKAVTQLLKEDLSWPQRLVLIGHIVELGARFFINPKDPSKSCENLAASKSEGFFFTPEVIAEKMVKLATEERHHTTISVLDPACGTGNLLGFSILGIRSVKRIIGVENDRFTAYIARKVLGQLLRECDKQIELDIIQGDGVDYLFTLLENRKEKFDVVIMNPPYGRIRYLRNSLTNKQTASTLGADELKILHSRMKSSTMNASQNLNFRLKHLGIGKGPPEYSRVFLRLATGVVEQGGRVVAITPATWLGDMTSQELRRFLFLENHLRSIISFKETAKFFQTVNQHTAIVSIEVGKRGERFELLSEVDSITDLHRNPTWVDLETIQAISPTWMRIGNLDAPRSSILLKLHKNETVGSTPDLSNLRGECDITFFKPHIRSENTGSRLVRGDHIERFRLLSASSSEKDGYVDRKGFEKQLGDVPKLQHSKLWRIAVPQCSYIQEKRRLAFCLVPPKSIVANSANYLFFKQICNNKLKPWPTPEILALLGVLNSAVVEWRFRIFNSNNHVGNYEIDEIPLPHGFITDGNLISDVKKLLELLSKRHAVKRIYSLDLAIEARVAHLFGLNKEELQLILSDIRYDRSEELLDVYSRLGDNVCLAENRVWNHTLPKLSSLDQEIIRHVPQGGNWQNIPDSVPSLRLKQIREMSKTRGIVRTTYYGRLRPNQPAYTIATYFNRPGNGTNIHPFENRTLTCREAARLQSFPDSFHFLGSEAAVRKQIGNAVPPLLGYAVGKLFIPTTCVDLFCGAGGLSYGMSLAGHSIVAAIDNSKNSIETFRSNHLSDAIAICDDITQEKIREYLINKIKIKLKGERLGLLVGGPPCQGFSTAGWRNTEDHRNGMVSYFLQIAKALKPKAICIENVEGILNMNGGLVIRDIHEVLREMGYAFHNKPWLLKAEEYGVPQMRRRVMIVAVDEREKLPVPPLPVFDTCRGRRELPTDHLRQSRPYPITVLEALDGLPELMPIKRNPVKREPQYFRPHYLLWCLGKSSVEEFLGAFSSEISGLTLENHTLVRRAKQVGAQKMVQLSLLALS